MKKLVIMICLAVVCLSVIFTSGCAGPGEKKGAHQVVGEGAAHAGLLVYDVGAMFVNTTWGLVSFGYGFEDGHAPLPLYDPEQRKMIEHKF